MFREAKARGWRDDGTYQKPTREEIEARRRQAAALAAKEEAEKARERAQAAKWARALCAIATSAREPHPYLGRKGLASVEGLREVHAAKLKEILSYQPQSRGETLAGRLLVVPVEVGVELSSVELIDEAGRKAFLVGRGTVAGGFWAAQALPDGDGAGLTILVAEGVATSLSAKEATGHLVIAALSSGNLTAVAKAMRERYPAATLGILADLGKGQKDAEEAARATGSALVLPEFGEDRPEGATDVNDMHRHLGIESVAQRIETQMAAHAAQEGARASTAGARGPGGNEDRSGNGAASGDFCVAEAVYRRLSDIQPKPIRWLWPGRIARGKVCMLAGHPGLGKSQAMISMAAIVSIGGTWPVDRTPCERGSVIILSAEDDAEDTIRPRLEAAGADLKRVFILDAIREPNRDGGLITRPFNLTADIERLSDLARKLGDVGLIDIDPITAYMGGVGFPQERRSEGDARPPRGDGR